MTIKEDGTFHLDVVSVYYFGDDLDDWLAKSDEDVGLADSATYGGTNLWFVSGDSQLVTYGGTGTWHTAGDSLWLELEKATISSQGGTEITISEMPAEFIRQIREMAAEEEEPISKEDIAAFEELATIAVVFFKEQLSFAGTYQLKSKMLSLSSSDWDGMDRIRVYTRPAGATAVAPISWGALKAGW